MSEESGIPYLREIVVFLGATVLIVPLFHRLKVSPILGYLLVGVVIGPYGLALVRDVEGVRRLAELGVIFLLFTIGLELSVNRLWAMRRLVFGLGTAQIVITGAIIAAIAYFWGNPPTVAVVLGAAFALSSTAMVLQLLMERGEFASRFGRTAFAVLLMQDLAVVPLLFLLNALGQPDGEGVGLALLFSIGRAVLAVAAIVIIGRLIVRPVFRLVASTRSAELFIAATLLGILGLAWATGAAGMSAPLGAFLAGLLIAETEFRPQVEGDIRPFRGLLLGLFFISVGMSINLLAARDALILAVPAVIGLVVIKAALAAFLAHLFGRPLRDAIRAGILLGQAGEFAFIILGAGLGAGIIPGETAQFMAVVVGLSMVVTPVLPRLGDICCALLPIPEEGAELPLPESDLEDHVIIAGFGRVGQTIAKILAAQKVPYLALETDPELVQAMRAKDEPVYFGNAAQEAVLERAGIDKARAVVVTINDSRAAAHTIGQVQLHWPTVSVFARSRDLEHSEELERLGADAVVPETEESSLQLGGEVLYGLGFPREAVNQYIEAARETNYARPEEAP